MKEEKVKKEKKAIRIPRLAVYVVAFVTGLILTSIVGFFFGVDYAAEFVTDAFVYGIFFILAYNVYDKMDKQPWRLTPKYWGLVALILVSDTLLVFASKAADKTEGLIRVLVLGISVVILGFYTYFVYAPSQKSLFADVKAKIKSAVADYITDHRAETPDVIADGLVEIVMAPKEHIIKKEEENV